MAIEMTGIPNTASATTQGDTTRNGVGKSNTDPSAPDNSRGKIVTDDVTITREAQDLIKIEAHVSQQSEIDHSRVSALKTEIDAGRYTIDPSRVADKFLLFEKMLSV